MRFNKISLAAMVLGGTMLLAACGGGDSAPAPAASVASGNTSLAINPTTGAATVASVLDKGFTFASGVPSFGTTSATSLTLSGSAATPSFAISSASGSASGAMTYGSCIFTVAASTFPNGHPLAAGSKVTVSPCTLAVGTNGVTANGGSSSSTVSLVLGTITSNPVSVTISISSTGVVSVSGLIVGNAALIAATGAGS